MECKYLTHGVRINEDGSVVPCCEFKGNIGIQFTNDFNLEQYLQAPQLLEMQKQMSQGVWPAGCINCKKREDLKLVSYRLRGNLEVKDKVVDVVVGKECNSDCVMCYAGQSSKIASRLHHSKPTFEVPKEDRYWITDADFDTSWANNENLWNNLLELYPTVERFKFLGGEPLLNKKLWQWLDNAVVKAGKSEKSLEIVTNGSVVSDKLILLSGWHKSLITISVDAYGNEYEWIRNGLKWNELEQNIQQFKANSFVSLHVTISMFSVTSLPQLLNWINENELLFSISPVVSPSLLALQNTPKHILEETLTQLKMINFSSMQNKIQLATTKNLIKSAIANNTENATLRKQITAYFNGHRGHSMDWETLRCTT